MSVTSPEAVSRRKMPHCRRFLPWRRVRLARLRNGGMDIELGPRRVTNATHGEAIMTLHTPDWSSRRGSVLTEQAFVLAAIVGIVLVAVARLGFETNLVFDQLSKTFPRLSSRSAGKQPAAKRGKRAPSTSTAGGSATPGASVAPASTGASKKMAGGRPRSGSGGGGISQAKRTPKRRPTTTVSSGVISTSGGSGLMAVLIGSR
jgi:hypothetical protein